MDWNLGRTGLDEDPVEPLVVSCEVVGVRDSSGWGPDLQGLWKVGRECLHKVHERQSAHGETLSDWWKLSRYTTAGKQQAGSYDDRIIDERWWNETIHGMGAHFDALTLIGPYDWGEVSWRAPVVWGYFGPFEHDAVIAHVTSPSATVEDDCNEWLEVLLNAASVDGVHTGYVHADSIADPYGKVVTERSRVSEDDLRSEVHGYYWAVLLTAGHLDRLGGRDVVLRDAPCERVEDLSESGRDAVLCVLTRSPVDLNSDNVRRWRQFLLPVLRPGYPGGLEDVGRRNASGAPLARPVWLFEGTPTPRHPGGTMGALLAGRLPEPPGSVPTPLPLEWARDPADGSFSVLDIVLGPDFSEEEHLAVLTAVVRAWEITTQLGKLPEVPDKGLGEVEDFRVHGAERRVEVRLEKPVPTAAMERLALVVSGLATFINADDPTVVFPTLRFS